MTTAASDLADLLRIARDTAIAASSLALQRRREGVEVAATKSTPIDIVTAADRETEQLIRSMLADARPDDGFLGEESGGGEGTSGLTWVVDPIDGTVNYLYDIPSWAVSIAVVEGEADPTTWRALAGAVVNPVTGEAFTATVGGGAFLGDRRLHVEEGVELDRALVGTGFAYDLAAREAQILVSNEVVRRARDLRRMGAASLDLCSVAAGRLDAYYEVGLKPWDMAAGALIAAEAGALVLGRDGGPASSALLVTGPESVARPLLELVERVLAEE